jgi:D-alanine-D-alanine ligase-like ATP-grasp enzyme
VFCQEIALTEVLQERIIALAIAASVVGQGLFKGVDLGYNEKLDDLFIIEVNGAPGIEGSNISRYVAAIQQLIY